MAHRPNLSAFAFALGLALAFAHSAPTSAAPVSATATLSIDFDGLAPFAVGGFGIVDIIGGVLTVPAGLVSLPGTLVVPVTGTTAIDSLSLVGVGNLAGTFSIGGITAQAPSEVCPGGMAIAQPLFLSSGLACDLGGGLGGLMGLTGTVRVNIIPNILVIPFNLNAVLIGQGGSSATGFSVDAAGWTTGTALLNTGVNVHATAGSIGLSALQLVTPLFASACGNLFPVFSALTIEWASVPEPAVWVSLWLGVFGLVWTTRRT